jgi:deazaflavin-dependent oxidoreductase (nitroreductase family)
VLVFGSAGLRQGWLRRRAGDEDSYRGLCWPAVDRYVRPGWFTRHVFNRTVALLTGMGVSIWGSRILAVRGRASGQWRTTPVNVLAHDGDRYLVAPRGTTQWVRNLRAAGEGELRLGKRVERFHAEEIADSDKAEILRAYLRRWKAEVGVFFGGVGAKSSDDQLLEIAPNHPVFRIGTEGRSF